MQLMERIMIATNSDSYYPELGIFFLEKNRKERLIFDKSI